MCFINKKPIEILFTSLIKKLYVPNISIHIKLLLKAITFNNDSATL